MKNENAKKEQIDGMNKGNCAIKSTSTSIKIKFTVKKP